MPRAEPGSQLPPAPGGPRQGSIPPDPASLLCAGWLDREWQIPPAPTSRLQTGPFWGVGVVPGWGPHMEGAGGLRLGFGFTLLPLRSCPASPVPLSKGQKAREREREAGGPGSTSGDCRKPSPWQARREDKGHERRQGEETGVGTAQTGRQGELNPASQHRVRVCARARVHTRVCPAESPGPMLVLLSGSGSKAMSSACLAPAAQSGELRRGRGMSPHPSGLGRKAVPQAVPLLFPPASLPPTAGPGPFPKTTKINPRATAPSPEEQS